jgi:hypothetical protein
MHGRHAFGLLTLVAMAITSCGGGRPDHSSPGLKRAADGLLIVPPLTSSQEPIPDPAPAGLGPEPKRYDIWWEKDIVGAYGYFDLVVHPTQMFLRATSPNKSEPDHVLWVRDLSSDQYRAICNVLDSHVIGSFDSVSDRTREGYTLFLFKSAEAIPLFNNTTDAATWQKLFNDISNRNLVKILKELNGSLPREVEPLFSQAAIVPVDMRIKILKEPERKPAAE